MKETLFSIFTEGRFGAFLLEQPEFKNLPTPFYRNFLVDKDIIGGKFDALLGVSNKAIASITAIGSSAPIRGRDAVKYLEVKNLVIQIARTRTEGEFLELITLLESTSDQAKLALIKIFADDNKFCFDGVIGRKDAMALQLFSTGKVEMTVENNPDGITSVGLDYSADIKTQKATVNWSTPATADPLGDIAAAKKTVKGLRFMLMKEASFYELIATDQMKASFLNVQLTSDTQAQFANVSLGLDEVNAILAKRLLPQVVILDTLYDVEKNSGDNATIDFWADDAVLFCRTLALGNFNNTKTVESHAIYGDKTAEVAVIDKVTLMKFRESSNPPVEKTIGKSISGIEFVEALNVVLFSTKSA